MNMEQTAREFFDACETGKGWEGSKAYCHEGATFACQADALAGVSKLSDYTEWMKGLFGPVPDGHYELHGFGVDSARHTVVAAATFHGTNTGEGGPVAPTGKTVAGDYVYVMRFEDGKIAHLTKVWNDQQSMRQMGWG